MGKGSKITRVFNSIQNNEITYTPTGTLTNYDKLEIGKIYLFNGSIIGTVISKDDLRVYTVDKDLLYEQDIVEIACVKLKPSTEKGLNVFLDYVLDGLSYKVDKNRIYLTKLQDKDIDRIIINGLEEYKIIICKGVFAKCLKLEFVSISSETVIMDYSFYKCSNLTSVVIPRCAYVGSKAFAFCRELGLVNIASVLYLGDMCFQSCSNLTSVSMDSTKWIGQCSFANCSSLRKVNLLKLEYLGKLAFVNCSSLYKVSLNDNIKFCDKMAFLNCII